MSAPKLTFYTAPGGPANPFKIATLLYALDLPHQVKEFNIMKGEQKLPEYLAVNPNGRLPALVDETDGDRFVIWESNAIMLYLVEKYDKSGSLGAKNDREKYELLQWLFFQASGQGPYFGQSAWFQMFHKEKIPSAIDRYNDEIRRVTGVLETVLAEKKGYLLGDGSRLTIADLSFIPWNNFAFTRLVPDFDLSTYPHVKAWHEKLLELAYVKRAYAEMMDFRKLQEEAKTNSAH